MISRWFQRQITLTAVLGMVGGSLFLHSSSAAAQSGTIEPVAMGTNCQWDRRCSTPGVRLDMREIRREGEGASAVTFYKAVPSGFPPGAILEFSMPGPRGPRLVMSIGYMLDSSGTLLCADSAAHAEVATRVREAGGDFLTDSWCLDVWEGNARSHMRPGEPSHFLVSTVDGQHRAYATVFVRPIRETNNECTLEAELLSTTRWIYQMNGWGFRPGDSVTVEARSGKEVMRGALQVDSAGQLPIHMIGPAVKRKKGGQATHKVTASTCVVAITYPWGDASR